MLVWLTPAACMTAAIYATVGLGGGSTYIALMAFAGVEHEALRVTALTLNLMVAGLGFFHFGRRGYVVWELTVPLVLASVPAAWATSLVRLPHRTFELLLASVLALVAVRMLSWNSPSQRVRKPINVLFALGLGGCLGALAGLVGIGGGIFLGPALILLGWADAKQAAGTASIFILANSSAGLVGHATRGNTMPSWAIALLVSVAIGGWIGSRLGSTYLHAPFLHRIFGSLVLMVAFKLMLPGL